MIFFVRASYIVNRNSSRNSSRNVIPVIGGYYWSHRSFPGEHIWWRSRRRAEARPSHFHKSPSCRCPHQKSRRSPEDSDQRGVNGVSVVDVHVVPAALSSEVAEAQPQHGIRAAGEQAQSEHTHIWWTRTTFRRDDIVYDWQGRDLSTVFIWKCPCAWVPPSPFSLFFFFLLSHGNCSISLSPLVNFKLQSPRPRAEWRPPRELQLSPLKWCEINRKQLTEIKPDRK